MGDLKKQKEVKMNSGTEQSTQKKKQIQLSLKKINYRVEEKKLTDRWQSKKARNKLKRQKKWLKKSTKIGIQLRTIVFLLKRIQVIFIQPLLNMQEMLKMKWIKKMIFNEGKNAKKH